MTIFIMTVIILAFSIMHDTWHYVAPFKLKISKYLLANMICSHSTCEVDFLFSHFASEHTELYQKNEMPVHRVHVNLWHRWGLNSGFPVLPSLGSQPQNLQNISEQLCC